MRSLAPILAFAIFLAGSPVLAQQPKPLPLAALDIRGFYTGLKRDPSTAIDLAEIEEGFEATDLPKRGLGGAASLQLYVWRGKNRAFGIGANGILARGRAQRLDEDGLPVGRAVTQRLVGFSPAISLNFGHRDGWSYVSAGMGPLAFSTYLGPQPPATRPVYKTTIDMGAGARWFSTGHVAFCFDLRFYLTRPLDTSTDYPGRSRQRLLVMSGGVALR